MKEINKKKFISNNKIISIMKKIKKPIWIYNEKKICEKIKELSNFDIVRYAQKACSNIHILSIMKENGLKVDAVSLGEIERALAAGYSTQNEDIVFTSDIFDINTLKKVLNLNITVNVGSIDMIHQIGKTSPNHNIWIRINPRFGHGHSKKTNTGGENSKHGIWYIKEAKEAIKKYKLKLKGLHMHIGSGVDYKHLKKLCQSMVEQVKYLDQDINLISAGGGLPIPYKKNDKSINIKHYFKLWNNARKEIEKYLGHKIKLEIEPGRFLVAESGLLITQIRAIKKIKNRRFILVDAGFNDLMRPIMYGSYHHISIIPHNSRKIKKDELIETVVGGPLCESGDIFTQTELGDIETRLLPIAYPGDYLIFYDTGAYGASMSSNYNSRPLIPEFLLKKSDILFQIRRPQTIKELLMLERIKKIF
ncbi:diaminopimelate decarboxylase [Buchnera aphidicola (Neophyllaphis varicolor)]|uniref:diaminopimelate decarboxylase n=1 Tax=Buchnera aphidicola TaxID=9 RepID=UPI0031B7EC8F